ncbi:MAG: hypothetical protein ABIA04_03420 [Pseudomonadota bacterium]
MKKLILFLGLILSSQLYANCPKNDEFIEPTITDVKKVAIKMIEGNINNLSTMAKGVKLKNLLPLFKTSFDKDNGNDISINAEQDGISTDLDIDSNFGFSLSFSWDFPELIFNSDQLRILRDQTYYYKIKHELILKISHLFYDRFKILLRNKETDISSDDCFNLYKLTSILDGYTDGLYDKFWFIDKEDTKK